MSEQNRGSGRRQNSDRPQHSRGGGRRGGGPRRGGGGRGNRSEGEWKPRKRRYGDRDSNESGGRRGGGPRRGGRYDREDNRNRGRRGSYRGRGGQRDRAPQSGPQRSGYREERINARLNEPKIPEGIDPRDLDPAVRQELRSLSKENADMAAKHMIMAATLLDENTERALEHARAAKNRAGRVAVARETCGITAYHAGEWKEAISELRAARRMQGGPGLLAVLADSERALGRPEKALEVSGEYRPEELDAETRAELAIVVAGAYQDLKRHDEAVVALEEELESTDLPAVTMLRVVYAYADALAQNGHSEKAIEYFNQAQELDTEELLDSEDRIAELKQQK